MARHPATGLLLAALIAAEHRAQVLGPPVSGWANLDTLATRYQLITWEQADGVPAALAVLEVDGLAEHTDVPRALPGGDTAPDPWMHATRRGVETAAANGHTLVNLRPAGDLVRWLCSCGTDGQAASPVIARTDQAIHAREVTGHQ